jgi:hypothetical protein
MAWHVLYNNVRHTLACPVQQCTTAIVTVQKCATALGTFCTTNIDGRMAQWPSAHKYDNIFLDQQGEVSVNKSITKQYDSEVS